MGCPPYPPSAQTIGIARERRGAILSSFRILGPTSKYILISTSIMGNDKELTEIHGVPFIPPFSTNIGIAQERRGAILSSLQILEATFKYIVSRVRIMGNGEELTEIHGVPFIPPLDPNYWNCARTEKRHPLVLSDPWTYIQIHSNQHKYHMKR